MTDTTKDDLKGKALRKWTEADREAAKGMGHTITLDYLTVRRLAKRGHKTSSYQDIIEQVLEATSTASPGVYSINATGEAVPLITEDGSGDLKLLRETLEDHGLTIQSYGDVRETRVTS